MSVWASPVFLRTMLLSTKRLYMLSDALGERALLGLLSLAHRRPKTERFQDTQVEKLKVSARHGGPVVDTVGRLMRGLHPNYISNFMFDLVDTSAWGAGAKRRAFIDQHGFEGPWLIVFSPTDRCNLRCTGCYSGAYAEHGRGIERLDMAAIDRIIEEAHEYGTGLIVWSGGEPTLIWDDLYALMEKHAHQPFLMYTNGTLITEKMAEQMVALGNLAVAVSVEGDRQMTTERRGYFRGRSVHDLVIDCMKMLHEHGVLVGYSVTYTRRNADYVASEEFIEAMLDAGCYYGWHFLYVPVGSDPDFSLVPTPEQRERMRASVWRWLTERGMLSFDFWNSGPCVARPTAPSGCMAADRYLHINHRGEAEPCVFCKYTLPGLNIKEKTLLEIIESPLFAAIRRRKQERATIPLLPCCFMDSDILAEAVAETGAIPTEGGQKLLEPEFRRAYLEPWRQAYGAIAQAVWDSGAYEDLMGLIGAGLIHYRPAA
jgi:MoaA/NifB/PqqE/SkfB family radical SAM enzyme